METAKSFDLDQLDAADQAFMTVKAGDVVTDWVWTFCGPGHPKAIAQNNRISRDQLNRNRLKEQAQVNGKKWRAPEQSIDEVLASNVNFVMERLLGWSEIKMGGEPYPFSEENARKLLMDPKKGALLQQAIEFVIDENSFMQRSAKN